MSREILLELHIKVSVFFLFLVNKFHTPWTKSNMHNINHLCVFYMHKGFKQPRTYYFRKLQRLPLFVFCLTIHCRITPSTKSHQYSTHLPTHSLTYSAVNNHQWDAQQNQGMLTRHFNYISFHCVIAIYTLRICFLTSFHKQCVQQLLFSRVNFTLSLTKIFWRITISISVNPQR